MIRNFTRESTKFNSCDCRFDNLNEYLLTNFTNVLKQDTPFNKTPYIFFKYCTDNKFSEMYYEENYKINNNLSIFAKPYNWNLFFNKKSSGNTLMFRNWINGENSKIINALTLIEKVTINLSEDDDFENYIKYVNCPYWSPTLKTFDEIKNKEIINQKIIENNLIIIE